MDPTFGIDGVAPIDLTEGSGCARDMAGAIRTTGGSWRQVVWIAWSATAWTEVRGGAIPCAEVALGVRTEAEPTQGL